MRLRTTNNRRRGTAVVEVAVILPIFLSVALGIMEFGRAMMASNLLSNAARHGARMAVIEGSSNADVEQAVQDFMSDSIGASPADVSVTISVVEAAGNPDCANEVGNAARRDVCTVHIDLPFDKVSLIPGNYLNGVNLVGHCAMWHE